MARRNVRLLRHKTDESSGKSILDIKGGETEGPLKVTFLTEYIGR